MSTPSGPSESSFTDDLVMRMITAVGEASETDPLTLPPLETAVDTEALAALVESDGLRDLTFSYEGHAVTIDGDGHVRVAQDTPTLGHDP